MTPVIEISQKSDTWPDVSWDICILSGVIVAMWCVIGMKTGLFITANLTKVIFQK